MNVQEAYNNWAKQYDDNDNKTRDLEAHALRNCLQAISFNNCLEAGCGTGKNTEWLATKANYLLAIDLSEEMLKKAKEKINSPKVEFMHTDMNKDWNFTDKRFNLIVFSLVLEHIQDLESILAKASNLLQPNGYIYIGELHPYKQYNGTKARFETEEGLTIVTCFTHHVSDFTKAAHKAGLSILQLNEYFDDDNTANPPRILSMVFQKK